MHTVQYCPETAFQQYVHYAKQRTKEFLQFTMLIITAKTTTLKISHGSAIIVTILSIGILMNMTSSWWL